MIEICKKQDCVGCGACLSACNKDAITMQPDALGFLYPEIDQGKCINCGLCAKSCFNNNKPAYNEPIVTCVGYAVTLANKFLRLLEDLLRFLWGLFLRTEVLSMAVLGKMLVR